MRALPPLPKAETLARHRLVASRVHRSDDELSDGVVDFFLRRFEEDGLRDTGRCMLLDAQWFAKARSDTQARTEPSTPLRSV